MRFEIRTGEDEPFAVEGDLLGEPIRFGSSPDKDEEGAGGTSLFSMRGLQGDALEMTVAGHADDLGAGLDDDVRRGRDLIDEVLRHAGLQGPADEHVYLAGVTGEVHCCLTGRVGSANDV